MAIGDLAASKDAAKLDGFARCFLICEFLNYLERQVGREDGSDLAFDLLLLDELEFELVSLLRCYDV